MSFSEADIASLADDFVSAPDIDIRAPRAFERMTGGNAGFDTFSRAVPKAAPVAAPRKCRRCRLMAEPNRSMCLRHLELRRRETNARNRKRGVPEWNGRGRPPRVVSESVGAEVALQEAMLADMLEEYAALGRRIARAKADLTTAKREARLARRGKR